VKPGRSGWFFRRWIDPLNYGRKGKLRTGTAIDGTKEDKDLVQFTSLETNTLWSSRGCINLFLFAITKDIYIYHCLNVRKLPVVQDEWKK